MTEQGRTSYSSLGVSMVLGCLACNMEAPASQAHIRDSAGVRIQEMSADGLAALNLTSTPIVQLSSAVAGEYALYRVRDVQRRSDGGFIVSNNGTELLWFDATGKYVATVGRRGEGPGEFLSINAVVVGTDDSLYVFDANLDRLTVMDPEGRVVSATRLQHPPDGSYYDILGVMSGGSILLSDISYTRRPVASGTVPHSFDVHLYDRQTHEAPIIGEYSRASRYRYALGDRFGVFPIPFQASASVDVLGDRLIVANGSRPEVQIMDHTGDLLAIVRFPREDTPVSASDISAYREMRLERTRSERNRQREQEVLDAIDYPRSWPFFQDLRVGDDGVIWVREDGPDLQDGLQRWTGFELEGAGARVVEIAGDFDVHSFGFRTLVGVARDDFDVEHVVVYGLEPGRPD